MKGFIQKAGAVTLWTLALVVLFVLSFRDGGEHHRSVGEAFLRGLEKGLEKRDAEKRDLLIGKWKDEEHNAITVYLPDGTCRFEGHLHITEPMDIKGYHIISTFDADASLHGRWKIIGDNLTTTVEALDQWHLDDIELSSSDFETKYGKQKIEEMRQNMKLEMSKFSTVQEEILGQESKDTIKSLDKSKLVTRDEEGKIECAYRIE